MRNARQGPNGLMLISIEYQNKGQYLVIPVILVKQPHLLLTGGGEESDRESSGGGGGGGEGRGSGSGGGGKKDGDGVGDGIDGEFHTV